MGKFRVGARVRDDGGDEGVIVEKAKGLRLVKYDYDVYGKLWQPKENLTALPANDNICAETSENAYSLGSEGADKPWVPKVGDRVAYKDDCVEGVGTIVAAAPGDDSSAFDWTVRPDVNSGLYFYSDDRFSYVTRHFHTASLSPAPLTIEAGKFYRTRDGRKVGPMKHWADGVIHPWEDMNASDDDAGGNLYRPDGTSDYAPNLVAEWVEPAAEGAVAEATATTARKFKVGDRVRYTGRSYERPCIGTVAHLEGDKVHCNDWSEGYRTGWIYEENLVLVPTSSIPIGSTVTFTATGRLSAINENGHYQVTFAGLPAGRNSFALPADYVSAN